MSDYYYSNTIFSLSERGNMLRFLKASKGNARFMADQRVWMYYDGECWRSDERNQVRRKCLDVMASISDEERKLRRNLMDDGEEPEVIEAMCRAVKRHAQKSQSARTVMDTLFLASSAKGVPVLSEDLDSDDFRLCCRNGVLNLKTGKLEAFGRDGLHTKQAQANFIGLDEPDPPVLMEFLSDITGGDAEFMDFLQRFAGYSATGTTSEETFLIFYGDGANGKSTFLSIIQEILGDYAKSASRNLLTAQGKREHSTILADIRGRRLVVSQELDESDALSMGLIKQLTGGDTITARELYGKPFQFQSRAKLVLATNHIPAIESTDFGTWRRIKIVPFNRRWKPKHTKQAFYDALFAQRDLCLSWIARGALKWLESGLKFNSGTVAETKKQRARMDSVKAFIDQCCIRADGMEVEGRILRYAYVEFCKLSGVNPVAPIPFGKRLTALGVGRRKGHSVYRTGVELRQGWDSTDMDAGHLPENVEAMFRNAP